MDVRCDKCGTEYEFDENRIGANGVTVKCTACGFVFKVRRPRSPPPRVTTTIGKGPQGKEWLVRKPDGQMIAFRELTTLQKWIVEGRIGRDDEISKNGETWKRLGNIMELEPFFSVYEKARTLNTLMDQSSLELRGSEVLSAANPIPQPQPLPIPQAVPTLPPSYSSASLPTVPSPGAYSQQPHPGSVVPALRGQMPLPAPRPEASLLPGNGMGGHKSHEPQKPAPIPPRPAPMRPVDSIRSQPAAIPDLSIRIDDVHDDSKSDIVSRFERSQRRKAVGWVMLFLILAGAGGGVALAMYGPEGNPIKGMAIKYGLLPSRPTQDDGAARLVEEAQSAADLDTLASLEKAAGLLAKAESIKLSDAAIPAERALVLVARAGAYRRWAKDLELAADRAEKHKADAKAFRAQAAEKAELAAPLLKEAFDLANAAAAQAPAALEPARALAAYHLIEKEIDAFNLSIEQAKAGMEKAGRVDPATLYLDAYAALGDPVAPDPAGLDRARGLLDQALTARPTMNAARILLARIHLAKSAPADAKTELDRVLATAPAHEEAQRLSVMAAIEAPPEAPVPAPAPPPPPPPAKAKAPPPPPARAEKANPDAEPADHPNTFEWWMQRAESLRERDRTNAALQAYDRAAELKPGSAEPFTGKGWCFLDQDRAQLALASFERALKVNSRFVMAYYGKAESYRALDETEKAIDAYEDFLSRAPASHPDRGTAEQALVRLKGEEN